MMYRIIFLSLFFPVVQLQAQVTHLNGAYQGEDLYFQNPADGYGFCTDSVYINGKKYEGYIESSAFVVELKNKGFKWGDSLYIKIYHKDWCAPKYLHAFHHTRTNTRVEALNIDESGLLEWKTKNDSTMHRILFKVEQYCWNKWIVVGEVEQPDLKQTEFSFQPVLHSGINQFRLKWSEGAYGKFNVSKTVTIPSKTPEVKFDFDAETKIVSFSNETRYEVYDAFGNMVKRGLGLNIDLHKLPRGDYYLHYDNREAEIKL